MSLSQKPTIHFISGLPRSGSTLLAALLNQNPHFRASMSGPVCGLVEKLLDAMGAGNEYVSFLSDEQRVHILRGLFANYYGEDFSSRVVFDTNRAWSNRLPLLATLFPHCRLIACVRQVPWIIDSIERLIRRNCLSPSGMFGYESAGSIYTRADKLANAEGMLGYGYNALKEAFFGDEADRLLVVRYETLTKDPAHVLAEIYHFLGEPPFPHDFDHVAFDAESFDRRLGTPGLHHVRPRVEWCPRKCLLPPNLIARFGQDAFWDDASANIRHVHVI